MKIITVVGARPQFIKALPLCRAWDRHPGLHGLVHTGQHFDANMSAIFFEELGLPPPVRNLGVGSASHARQTAQMMAGLETAFEDLQPELVVVLGDTNSTLAGALTAAKMKIPVAHVEAGLRSFNRAMPEEVNRLATDAVCDLLFAPSLSARDRLLTEGQAPDRVHLSGDVMYDAVRLAREDLVTRCEPSDHVSLDSESYAVVTCHRPENTDTPDRLFEIFRALQTLADEWPLVFPMHPRTSGAAQRLGLDLSHPGIEVIEPVGFLDMMQLLSESAFLITDSGGLQKEAFFHGKPCFVLRDETEWIELETSGWVRCLYLQEFKELSKVVQEGLSRDRQEIEPYGNGRAAEVIVGVIVDHLGPL